MKRTLSVGADHQRDMATKQRLVNEEFQARQDALNRESSEVVKKQKTEYMYIIIQCV